MDDLRIGRIARALRHRLNLTQTEVGRRWGRSQDRVSWIERGRLDGMTLRRLRHLFAVFDAELVVFVRWRGGDVDRLLDRGHAALAEAVAGDLEPLGWVVEPEVSYSEFGERGSIDLLAWHPASRSLLVIEVKTELTSIEETIRRHDVKTRLGAKIARDRLGWDPISVSRLLVLPDERTPRRHVEGHQRLFAGAYPVRGWDVRRWLRTRASSQPPASMAGLLFLPLNGGTRAGRGLLSRRRITSRSQAVRGHSAPPARS